ncbi:MAG: NERD domain-containing protein [Candidatus Omnitrophota bacterium]
MARMIPPQIGVNFKSSGEKRVFDMLMADKNTDDWIALHSLDVVDHQTRITGELDFVVLVPGYGILCIEVKGCSHLMFKDGVWMYGTDFSPDRRGPFRQASEGMHSLRQYVQEKENKFIKVPFWYAVIFPYVDFNVKSPEWHEWQVIDKKALSVTPISELLFEVMKNALRHFQQKGIKFSPEYFTKDKLEGMLQLIRPNFEYFESPLNIKEKSGREIKNYTEEQFNILDAMESNQRVLFTGPAGTGKTLLAIEAVRRACLGGKKYCCFASIGSWGNGSKLSSREALWMLRLQRCMDICFQLLVGR